MPITILDSFMRNKKWKEARTYFEQALRLDPNFVIARLNLGRVFATQGETKAAREEFLWILQRYPNHSTALDELQRLD